MDGPASRGDTLDASPLTAPPPTTKTSEKPMTSRTFDFEDGSGPVPAHLHANGGGWVANTAWVFGKAQVADNARVFGTARVSGNARVSDNARVFGKAQVADNAWVFGTARVYDNACVFGNARVSGKAWVFGKAWVSGNARVSGNACVYGNARVSDNARVYGTARVYGKAQVRRRAPMVVRSDGYTFIYPPCADGEYRIIAGCRYLTMPEAEKHWTETRGGTRLGAETIEILNFFKRARNQ